MKILRKILRTESDAGRPPRSGAGHENSPGGGDRPGRDSSGSFASRPASSTGSRLAPLAGSRSASSARRDSTVAIALVIIVGLLMQAGSAVAVLVIADVGVVEAVWLRTAFAAVLLALVRPSWLRLPAREDRLPLLLLTLSLVLMNFSFYQAISRAPVGIVVAVEFLGPLGVAVAGSRRVLDGVWVVLAGAGVALLARPGGPVQPLGLVFALLAALFWALFILSAKRVVGRIGSLRATVLMLVGAAVLLTPAWLATGVRFVGHGRAVLLGLAVAVLSSALPYLLELAAIKRVRPSTYGVLLSIEPAIAALMGFAILGQRLAPWEMVAIGSVVIAAGGAAWTSGLSGSGSVSRRREEGRRQS